MTMLRPIACRLLPLIVIVSALSAQETPPSPPPQIFSPGDLVLGNDAGRCSASGIIFGIPVARDFTGGHSISARRNDDLQMTDPFPRGLTVVIWTVTDAAGQTAAVSQLVKVNNTESPQIIAPRDIETTADDACFATKLDRGEPVITENCPDSTLSVTAKDINGNQIVLDAEHPRYPAGVTILTWRLIDAQGRDASATQRIVVKPAERPQIATPPNVVAETDHGKCTAFVDVAKPAASSKCSIVSIQSTRSDGRRRVDMPFPEGRTTILWTATDAAGLTASAEQEVVVKHTEGPSIGDVKTDPTEIWPPNDRMVGVKVSYDAEDACGGPVETSLSVTSNERVGNIPDWDIVNKHYVDLRATRAGSEDRIYTISVKAVDGLGKHGQDRGREGGGGEGVGK